MARSRKIRKRESRPRRRTNKRGKKALRAKTHKKTARRTRVKAHRPRRNARVTRRRVHRKRGGKGGVADNAAHFKTAHDGQSLAVKTETGILHGRSPPSKGSSSSKVSSSVPVNTVSPQQAAQAFTNLYNKQTEIIAATGSGVGGVLTTVGGIQAVKAWRAGVQAAARSDDLTKIASEGKFATQIAKQPARTVYKVGGKYFRSEAQAEAFKESEHLTTSVPIQSQTVGGDMEVRLMFKRLGDKYMTSEPIKLAWNAEARTYTVEDPGQLRSSLADLETLQKSLKEAGMAANSDLDTSIQVLQNLETKRLSYESAFNEVTGGEQSASRLTSLVSEQEEAPYERSGAGEGYDNASEAADDSDDWASVFVGLFS